MRVWSVTSPPRPPYAVSFMAVVVVVVVEKLPTRNVDAVASPKQSRPICFRLPLAGWRADC